MRSSWMDDYVGPTVPSAGALLGVSPAALEKPCHTAPHWIQARGGHDETAGCTSQQDKPWCSPDMDLP